MTGWVWIDFHTSPKRLKVLSSRSAQLDWTWSTLSQRRCPFDKFFAPCHFVLRPWQLRRLGCLWECEPRWDGFGLKGSLLLCVHFEVLKHHQILYHWCHCMEKLRVIFSNTPLIMAFHEQTKRRNQNQFARGYGPKNPIDTSQNWDDSPPYGTYGTSTFKETHKNPKNHIKRRRLLLLVLLDRLIASTKKADRQHRAIRSSRANDARRWRRSVDTPKRSLRKALRVRG